MQKPILFLFLTWFVLHCQGQEYAIETMKNTNPGDPADVYTFPILTGGNENICSRINDYIVQDQGLIPFEDAHISIFENVWSTEDRPVASLNYFDFKVELLTHTLYSVSISAEFCGAYCEGYTNTYTFDLSSGSVVPLDTLFSSEGKIRLLQKLNGNKSQRLSKKIEELNILLTSDTLQAPMKDTYDQMLEMYEICLESPSPSLAYFRFIPSKHHITIIGERCSAHYNRDIDELWEFIHDIELDRWNDYLSEYGRGLLLEK